MIDAIIFILFLLFVKPTKNELEGEDVLVYEIWIYRCKTYEQLLNLESRIDERFKRESNRRFLRNAIEKMKQQLSN